MSRFPVAFRPSAFASWPSFARWGAGSPLGSAYRLTRLVPNGVATFHACVLRPGWVPSIPRERRCLHGRKASPAAASRFATACLFYPARRPTIRASYHEASVEGSILSPVRPSLACGHRVERGPWAFLELHSPSLPTAHVEVGTGHEHYLCYVAINWPSCRCNYSHVRLVSSARN
jgi:hypothetical protein